MPVDKAIYHIGNQGQKFFDERPVKGVDTSYAEKQAAHLLKTADAFADGMALRYLADESCPKDVKDFGERHKIPLFAQTIWKDAFMNGWKAALRAKHAVEKAESDDNEKVQ